jgi:hypothetical protein
MSRMADKRMIRRKWKLTVHVVVIGHVSTTSIGASLSDATSLQFE